MLVAVADRVGRRCDRVVFTIVGLHHNLQLLVADALGERGLVVQQLALAYRTCYADVLDGEGLRLG